MGQYKIKKLKVISGLLLLILGAYLFVTTYTKRQVEHLLSHKLPAQLELKYESLSLSLFTGSAVLNAVVFQIKNSTLDSIKTHFNIKTIEFSGLGITSLIQGEEIELNRLVVSKPVGYYTPTPFAKDTAGSATTQVKTLKSIQIKDLEIKEASLTLKDKKNDSTRLTIGKSALTLNALEINLESGEKPSVNFEDYVLDLNSLLIKASIFEELEIDRISGNKNQTTLEGIAFKTIPTPEQLSKMIAIERDHYQIITEKIALHDLRILEPESNYLFSASLIDIDHVDLAIYRDKLLADDRSYKPTFSELIRKVPWPFMIDSVSILPKKISYQERVVPTNKGGQIFFTDGHFGIKQLSNQLPLTENTTITLHSRIMGKADIQALWTFNSNNPAKTFRFRGNCKNVQLDELNTFFKPNLNSLMSGEVKSLFFDFSGNNIQSLAKAKIHYKNVEIVVLRKKGGRRNKFYSSMANILVRNNSRNKDGVFKEEQVTVTRDKTKSQFNYLYLNLKESMMRAFL